ncbi:reverse transcriptase domain-containing protein [Photorhabdus heterorhabditis]|uniref:reverse transcriptase domain-containing protein n=1 Tax=Photorhabdus heterorhabditis TaxID=880156 RepID=UPI001BD68E47|nr:reverse transcriptase domain-containing protein [Photorhabdus heterorhabditis]MBS9443418.1 reverse transcriptase [Photorhabdus heterorhabditis]
MSASRHFKRNFSAKNLRNIYFEKIKESDAIGIDRIRPNSLENILEEEISIILRKVLSGNYKFTAYKEKLISKGPQSFPRQISIPTIRDRITLRALCDSLTATFPNSKLTIPQTVIESLQDSLRKGIFYEYAKVDLKNFYPSIPHNLIEKSLKKKIRKPEFLALIKSAITTPTTNEVKRSKTAKINTAGVPQGLSISNVLAEVALSNLDLEMNSIPDIWYKRYVDDILVLTPINRAKQTAEHIISSLTNIGLTPHPLDEPESKTKVSALSESFNFLGYQIESGKVLIRRESILRFESSLAKIFTAYRYTISKEKNKKNKDRAIAYCQWKLNLRITGCIFEKRKLGWVAYFSQISSTVQLRSVNHTVNKLLTRFGLNGIILPKSLIKTFYELQRGDKTSHKYIPNFDNLDINKKRDIVALWIGKEEAGKLNNNNIEKKFKYKISSSVKELEEDLNNVS